MKGNATYCEHRKPNILYTQCRSGLKLQTSAETNEDEYVRVGIVQETSTYECLEVRRRVHTTGDEYIRVSRGQEMSTYDRRRVHTSA